MTSTPHDLAEGFPDITFARGSVDSSNPFLYHKTTHRLLYEELLGRSPGARDVLLFNEHGHVTESTIANVVVSVGGALFTPPVESGLLPGTLRAHLIEEGRLKERVMTREDVRKAEALYLINSVRGCHPVRLNHDPYNSVVARPGL
jgi:para-aminobenzoate synthetase/4-amino-4-deoxychorismate lyase